MPTKTPREGYEYVNWAIPVEVLAEIRNRAKDEKESINTIAIAILTGKSPSITIRKFHGIPVAPQSYIARLNKQVSENYEFQRKVNEMQNLDPESGIDNRTFLNTLAYTNDFKVKASGENCYLCETPEGYYLTLWYDGNPKLKPTGAGFDDQVELFKDAELVP